VTDYKGSRCRGLERRTGPLVSLFDEATIATNMPADEIFKPFSPGVPPAVAPGGGRPEFSDYRLLALQTVSDENAVLRACIVDLEGERDIYCELLQISLGQQTRTVAQLEAARLTIDRLKCV
jgi:hypothetical protein